MTSVGVHLIVVRPGFAPRWAPLLQAGTNPYVSKGLAIPLAHPGGGAAGLAVCSVNVIKCSFRRSVRRFSLSPSVAVAILCYNEATTIAKIVRDFRRVLPQGEICVFNNASTDETAERAREAGARVVAEPRRGKGFVVQRVFEIVDADICVLVDGDDTYLAEDLDTLLAPILAGEADMVVGNRLANASAEALTGFRRFGNRFFIGLVNLLTRTTLHDVLCGYRAMNRLFRKAVQLQSSGFEIELTLRAVREGMAIREVPIGYRERPTGSYSKLSPVKDGLRILWVITAQLIGLQERPRESARSNNARID